MTQTRRKRTTSARNEMIIDTAAPGDLDAIYEIECHSFPEPWPRAAFAVELARDVARLEVARAPAVIGYCNYWVVISADGPGEIQIHTIATHPDHRRRGVGAALMAHALATGSAAGCHVATLEVRRGNAPAIALYERLGFRTIHVRAGYYHDNGEDALVMLRDGSP